MLRGRSWFQNLGFAAVTILRTLPAFKQTSLIDLFRDLCFGSLYERHKKELLVTNITEVLFYYNWSNLFFCAVFFVEVVTE